MSACPHTDNADKCTCGPGCGCDGQERISDEGLEVYESGQPNAAILELAFWEAIRRCGEDDRVHDMAYPYHDDPKIDGDITAVLWEHMAWPGRHAYAY